MSEISHLIKDLINAPTPEQLFPEVKEKTTMLLRGQAPESFSSNVALNACCLAAIVELAKKMNNMEAAIRHAMDGTTP